MHPTPAPIATDRIPGMAPTETDSNRELLEIVAEAVHQISHDLRALRLLAERHSGVLEGFQAGGLLGARAARKRAANGKVDAL